MEKRGASSISDGAFSGHPFPPTAANDLSEVLEGKRSLEASAPPRLRQTSPLPPALVGKGELGQQLLGLELGGMVVAPLALSWLLALLRPPVAKEVHPAGGFGATTRLPKRQLGPGPAR